MLCIFFYFCLSEQKLKRKIDGSINVDGAAIQSALTSDDISGSIFNKYVVGDSASRKAHSGSYRCSAEANCPTGLASQFNRTVSGDSFVRGSKLNNANVDVTEVRQDASLPHLSVQIVQQISTERKNPQTIHTSVTVSSTLHAGGNNRNNAVKSDIDVVSDATNLAQSGSNINIRASSLRAKQHPQQHPHYVDCNGDIKANNAGIDVKISDDERLSDSLPLSSRVKSETRVFTNIDCKQEMLDSRGRSIANDYMSQINSASVPDLPFDELQTILDSLEKNDEFSSGFLKDAPNLLRELDDFDKIFQKVQSREEGNQANVFFDVSSSSLVAFRAPVISTSFANIAEHVAVSSQCSPTTISTVRDSVHSLRHNNPSLRPSPALNETTGPAAKCLKQIAAQHQVQNSSTAYHSKTIGDSEFVDPYDQFGGSRASYPGGYGSANYVSPAGVPSAPVGYPAYAQNGCFGDSSTHLGPYHPCGSLDALQYPQSEPLCQQYQNDSHVDISPLMNTASGPSCLQQLQDQVASHFSPLNNIAQSQHVQVVQGPKRLHISQAQQMQIGIPAQQHVLAQHQSFDTSGFVPVHHKNSALSMPVSSDELRMMRSQKLRREHQQQYMNRPPPEYKMHTSGQSVGFMNQGGALGSCGTCGTYGGRSGSNTPLHSTKNMMREVPQYRPNVNREDASNCVVVPDITAMQSMSVSGFSPGNIQTNMSQAVNIRAAANNMQRHISQHERQPTGNAVSQRPLIFPSQVSFTTHNGIAAPVINDPYRNARHRSAVSVSDIDRSHDTVHSPSSGPIHDISQINNAYESANMRIQRPPNMNVKPDGVNISQPRRNFEHIGHGVPYSQAWQGPVNPAGVSFNHAHGTLDNIRQTVNCGQVIPLTLPYSHRPRSCGSFQEITALGQIRSPPPVQSLLENIDVDGVAHVMMQQNMQISTRDAGSLHSGEALSTSDVSKPDLVAHSSSYNNISSFDQSQTFDSLSLDWFNDILK